jgi:hypothetical protein
VRILKQREIKDRKNVDLPFCRLFRLSEFLSLLLDVGFATARKYADSSSPQTASKRITHCVGDVQKFVELRKFGRFQFLVDELK